MYFMHSMRNLKINKYNNKKKRNRLTDIEQTSGYQCREERGKEQNNVRGLRAANHYV